MKKFFSLSLYLDTLKRLRVFATVVTVILTATALLNVSVYYQFLIELSGGQYASGALGQFSPQRASLTDINGLIGMFVTFVVPAMTVSAFSYLMKRNESDFYEALPISRRAMLISGISAVISIVLAVMTVSTVLSLTALIPCMGRVVNYDALKGLVEFLAYTLAALVAIFGASVAVSVSGTARNAVFVSFVLLFLPRSLLSIINACIQLLVPTLDANHIIPLFDNSYNMYTGLFWGSGTEGKLVAYVYSLALCAVYALLAYVLFMRRRSEAATHPYAFTLARHITAVALSTVIFIGGLYILLTSRLFLVLLPMIVIIALVVFFVFDYFSQGKDKRIKETLISLCALVCAVALSVLLVFASSALFKLYSPSADDIDSFSLNSDYSSSVDYYYTAQFEKYVAARAGEIPISDPESRRIVSEALKRSNEGGYNSVSASSTLVKINSPLPVYRRIIFTSEELRALNMTLAENEQYRNLWLNVAENVRSLDVSFGSMSLTNEAAMRVLSVMQQEIHEIGFSDWYDIYVQNNTEGYVFITYNLGAETFDVNFGMFTELKKTYAAFTEEIKKQTLSDYNELKEKAASAVTGDSVLHFSLWLETDNYDYYELDFDLSKDLAENKALIDRIISLTEPTPYIRGEEEGSVSFYLYDDYLFSKNYGEFSVPKDKLDEIVGLFKSYEK